MALRGRCSLIRVQHLAADASATCFGPPEPSRTSSDDRSNQGGGLGRPSNRTPEGDADCILTADYRERSREPFEPLDEEGLRPSGWSVGRGPVVREGGEWGQSFIVGEVASL